VRDEGVEVLNGCWDVLAELGRRAVRLDNMEHGPGADLLVGGRALRVTGMSSRPSAVQRVALRVQPVAGARGRRLVKGQGQAVSWGSPLEDGRKARASHLLLGPALPVGPARLEGLDVLSRLDRP
jgi:hypothetical protein